MGGCFGRVPERRSSANPEAANSYATPENSESEPNAKPKNVVPIPVNFLNSETPKSKRAPAMIENTAVIKIQAAFRGFYVRKPMPLNKLRVITTIKEEAAEIRRRVNDENFVNLIARDENMGLKLTERIMSLLLRLDEIQVAIPFVRASRKAVIRDLVNLQETVDDIIAPKSRQNVAAEVSLKSERGIEEFKSKELAGGAIEVSVSNEIAEECLPSQKQIEGLPEGVEIFGQGSSETGQIVSGTEECTLVDVVDKDADNLKKRRCSRKIPCTVEGIIEKSRVCEKNPGSMHFLEADASPAIPGTKEGFAGNSRENESSSESLDSLKVQTIQSDGKLETTEFMVCEEAGDKMPEKVKQIGKGGEQEIN